MHIWVELVVMVYVEWLLGLCLWLSSPKVVSTILGATSMGVVNLRVHLWMATQGTKGSEELRVKIASSAAIANGLWLDKLSCVDSPRLDKQM